MQGIYLINPYGNWWPMEMAYKGRYGQCQKIKKCPE